MKSLLIATLLIGAAGHAGSGVATPLTGTPVVIVQWGESNSGGLASNLELYRQEMRARTIPIYNNQTGFFEPLMIGKNNLRLHYGLEYAQDTAHGMENELANQYGLSQFGNHPVYLVKAGQGGSTTAMWDGSTYYRDTLYNRVARACSLVNAATGKYPVIVSELTVGINERSSTPAGTYKSNIQAMIAGFKSNFSGKRCLFGLMQFQFVGTMSDFDTKLAEIAAADTMVFTFPTTGCPSIGDGIHLSALGFRICGKSFTDSLLKRL